MKKIVNLMIAGLLVIGMAACDVLDNKDLSTYTPDAVWSDANLANAYVVNLYSSVFTLFDEYRTIQSGWPVNQDGNADIGMGLISEGDLQTTNMSLKCWPYTTIRKINLLLGEIDEGTLDDDVKNPMKGQALFLRAYAYFKAVVYHGGVPYLKAVQSIDDDLMVPRNSTKECFDFIIKDLDDAAGYLPDRYTDSDYGRADKAAVLAFKARVLLYKASPQFNPSNPYDNTYWQEALTANKTAKETLESLGYGLVDTYDEIFKTEAHKEAVLAVVYKNPGKTNGRQEAAVRPLSQSKNATGGDQPTWDFVATYPMKDGKAPGQSTKYTYDVQTFWKDRDPRFESTIVYNGCIYEISGIKGRRQYTDIEIGHPDDRMSDDATYSRSGLYTKKGVEEDLPQAEIELNSTDWLEIRFAEVLLNYAETANETGNTNAAYDVLKQIRKRAGIEAGGDDLYGLSAGMTREQMRDAIMTERKLEFPFEGKRFYDLRRTRRLGEVNGMEKHGIEAKLKDTYRDASGKIINMNLDYKPEDFVYTVKPIRLTATVKTMYLPDSYYFYPIYKDDIEKNPKLQQNVGWDGGTFDPTLH